MRALIGAFGFLTIIPTGGVFPEQAGHAFTWFPLVGLVIGALLAGVSLLPVPDGGVHAFLLLAMRILLTGGLHLDGLADSCDGLFASVPVERRLAIMKDPRAGSWAVIGLVVLLLGKWSALRALPAAPATLLVTPVAARWAMVVAVAAFPYARQKGTGGLFRQGFGPGQVLGATGLTALILGGLAAVTGSWLPLLTAAAALLTVFLFGGWAARRLGGCLTGDTYGAVCEITETVCLMMGVVLA
ncbi:MAG: adenosylcobinamide-GDP ribazoletransferase [Anaerolineae bacterium]